MQMPLQMNCSFCLDSFKNKPNQLIGALFEESLSLPIFSCCHCLPNCENKCCNDPNAYALVSFVAKMPICLSLPSY